MELEISGLPLKIILLLLPGVLATLIFEQLTIHKKWLGWKWLVYAILFSILSYLLLQISFWICVQKDLQTWNAMLYKAYEPSYIEVLWSLPISIALGFFASKFVQKKWLFKFARKYKFSNKFGDENLYYYLLNSKDVEWIYLRDMKNKLTYRGKIEHFSEGEVIRELVLGQVTVFDETTSNELYRCEQIYLSFTLEEKLQIELP